MQNRKNGFTLVELMIAALLAGIALIIALPLILVGRNADVRTEQKEAIALAGEAIYEYVADEVKFAGRLYIGSLNKRPEGENWKSITVSEKNPEDGEDYARLLFGSARELTENGEPADPGEFLYNELFQEKTDLVIEAEAEGRNQLRLSVKLMDGDQALYEKASVLSLLNLTLNATNQIEGYVGGVMSTAWPVAATDDESETSAESLVLWYQSSKETVNPFHDKNLGAGEEGELIPGPGGKVVSLANPQYVGVDQTLEVQYRAQAESNPEDDPENDRWIVEYDWSLDNDKSEDGSPYVQMAWDESTKLLTVKGVMIPDDTDRIRLTLVVTYNDGTTAKDTCDLIVYEGNMPGNQPVAEFVIVPDGLEEIYAKNPNYPVWIRAKSAKRLWLEAVDEEGNLVPYSPENWIHPSNQNTNYKGFNFVSNGSGSPLKGDGKFSLEGYSDGKNYEVSSGKIGRNYVTIEALRLELGGDSFGNSQTISFGGNGETAYRPNGTAAVKVDRLVNIYDADAKWSYRTDADGSEMIHVPSMDDPRVQVLSTAKTVELAIDLETTIRLSEGVERGFEPIIDLDSVKWFLEGRPISEGNDFCLFGIKENAAGAAQLSIGDNRISVEFEDTAGFSYSQTVIIKVPSEVAYVKLKQDKYVLLNLNQKVDGVSSQDIEFELYDEDGEIVYDGLDDESIKKAYEAKWILSTVPGEDGPFELKDRDNIATIETRNEGTGTITLILKELGSNREITGEDGSPCSSTVEVKSMEMSLKLRYRNADSGEVSSIAIESGKAIPVFSTTANRIAGFDAELRIPSEVEDNLTERQWSVLNSIKWNRVNWKNSNSGLFWGNQQENTNVFAGGYNYGTGTAIFSAEAVCDSGVMGEVTVIINEAPVGEVQIENVRNNGSELVIGAGAKKENDQYNAITLKADISGQNGKDCDKNVIWTILSGRELADTQDAKLNIEVDSTDSKYYPIIRLKKGLSSSDAGKKIIVRATSPSSGRYADYEIMLLPKFEITYPYSKSFIMTHMSNSTKNVPDSRNLEANRTASWKLSVNGGGLKLNGPTENVTSATVETQKYSNDSIDYTVTGTDFLTGQTDFRKITVKYEEIKEQSGTSDGWLIHMSPNGLKYLDIGDSVSVNISSSFPILDKNSMVVEGNSGSVSVDYNRNGWYSASARITGVYPGESTIYAKWIPNQKSFDFIKIIVRGLQLQTTHTADVSSKNLNMNSLLKYGDVDEFQWDSSNPNIATINDDGVVTLLTPGKTTITVSGRANSTGTNYISKCELSVTAAGWGTVSSITNKWKDFGSTAISLLAGSSAYETAVMLPTITGSNSYPVYYITSSETEGKLESEILRVEGNTVVAVGAGSVTIVAGAADKTASPLTAKVYALNRINVSSNVEGGMLNFITEGANSLTLTASLDWGSSSSASVPSEFKKYAWEVDEKSAEYVDIITNADGTCTVTAKGMGAAYITCRSTANPDIYETYVVIVSF